MGDSDMSGQSAGGLPTSLGRFAHGLPTSAGSLGGLVSANAALSGRLYLRSNLNSTIATVDSPIQHSSINYRRDDEYSHVTSLPETIQARTKQVQQPNRRKPSQYGIELSRTGSSQSMQNHSPIPNTMVSPSRPTMDTIATEKTRPQSVAVAAPTNIGAIASVNRGTNFREPTWHAPWKLMRVISGHLGWVRALAVEPGNQWFASGAGDRTIKIWDLATGTLRLTLTGHISTVRGLAVSSRHPYLFSCGEDKMVKCWDLETNTVIRHYHGHLSGVYTLSLHPTLDVLVTGGRDGVARVWDMRTRSNIIVLSGHSATVSVVQCQEADPQVISASLDSTVRLWDLAAGKAMGVLTHHKKGVRALTTHPREFTFATGSTGTIKQWMCPDGAFMQNFEGHNAIINTLSVNASNILFSGGDDGSMSFWDWKTGHRFQDRDTVAQPGSLDAERGIMSSCFDRTGTRLLCGEADKTIKIWKEDETASEETHPLPRAPVPSQRLF